MHDTYWLEAPLAKHYDSSPGVSQLKEHVLIRLADISAVTAHEGNSKEGGERLKFAIIHLHGGAVFNVFMPYFEVVNRLRQTTE